MRAVWLAALVLAGCAKVEAFECEADVQCFLGDKAGACEPSGFCSFPDAGCPGGKRYGEYAGEGLGGSCVEGGATSGVTSGDTSGGACADDCGPCGSCVAGSCAPVGAGEACAVECDQLVFGLSDDQTRTSCLAYASGQGSGTCDGAGACVPGEGGCAAAGAEIASCDLTCTRADHNCVAGTPVAAVSVASLCSPPGPSEGCKPSCVDTMGEPSQLSPLACDAAGKCVPGDQASCGGFTCADKQSCRTTCSKQNDCVQGYMCVMMTMVCEQ